MSRLRLLTTLVLITGIACWTDPFNWHFLPKHYRLYSNVTAHHTVQFDTDCGTLAADSGATHFLWDPESRLCSISSGLTAAEFSAAKEQDPKTSFYYVRDFALVVPPGSPNCPTEAQLKRMIDNLKSMRGSFTAEADPTRRTWRDKCKKNENADATNPTTREATPSSTSNATTTFMASSDGIPVTNTTTTSPRTSPSTVEVNYSRTGSSSPSPAISTQWAPTAPLPMTNTTFIVPSDNAPVTTADTTSPGMWPSTAEVGYPETGSSSTNPATSTHSTKPSHGTLTEPPAAAATAPLPMANAPEPAEDTIITRRPFTSVTGAKTTALEETGDSVTTTSSVTVSGPTTAGSPTAAATPEKHSSVSNAMTQSPSTSVTAVKSTPLEETGPTTTAAATPVKQSSVANTMTRSPFTSITSAKTASIVARDTTAGKESTTSTPKAMTSPVEVAPASATSDATVDETTPTPSRMSASTVSGMPSGTTSSSNPATSFTRYVTTAWEMSTKSESMPSLSQTTSRPVTTHTASSTLRVPTQESTPSSPDTVKTNTRILTVPPSPATATTTGGVKTTLLNGKTTTRVASKASSTPKTRNDYAEDDEEVNNETAHDTAAHDEAEGD